MKKLLLILTAATSFNIFANTTVVEFFKLTDCKDPYKISNYTKAHHYNYRPISIDGADSNATGFVYYAAVNAGVGPEFRDMYCEQLADGKQAYSERTLDDILQVLANEKLNFILNNLDENIRVAHMQVDNIVLSSIFQADKPAIYLFNDDTLAKVNKKVAAMKELLK